MIFTRFKIIIKDMKKQINPNKKENKATLKSKRKIREAYLELLAENQKKNKDIRIVEIANRADINRGTFYAYYSSIEELEKDAYESITNQLLEEIYNTPLNDIVNSPIKYINLITSIISNNLSLFKKLEKTRYADAFVRRIISRFVHIANEDDSLKEVREKIADTQLFNFLIITVLNGLIGSFRECIHGSLKIPMERYSEYVAEATRRLMGYIKYVMQYEEVLPLSTYESMEY